MSTITQYQQLGKYLFVSMDQKKEIGSVYYEKGRIRLVHKSGPEISGHDYIAYFVVPDGFGRLIKNDYNNKTFGEIYDLFVNKNGLLLEQTNNNLMQGHNYKLHSINNINNINLMRLYEVYFKNKNNIFESYNQHPSRGYPNDSISPDYTRMKDIFDAIHNGKDNAEIYKMYNARNPLGRYLIHDPQKL